ncbi:MAG: hypothetical protein J6Z11_09260 [Candidatus Riflebacteria bacterium]|nr:hypothetical protein [Candidatus Riflebacteria bacterium]
MKSKTEQRLDLLEDAIRELASKMTELMVLVENVMKIDNRKIEALSDRLWVVEKEKGLRDVN